MRMSGPYSRDLQFWKKENLLPLLGFKYQTVYAVPSRYMKDT